MMCTGDTALAWYGVTGLAWCVAVASSMRMSTGPSKIRIQTELQAKLIPAGISVKKREPDSGGQEVSRKRKTKAVHPENIAFFQQKSEF